jgi:hypothetical protein
MSTAHSPNDDPFDGMEPTAEDIAQAIDELEATIYDRALDIRIERAKADAEEAEAESRADDRDEMGAA